MTIDINAFFKHSLGKVPVVDELLSLQRGSDDEDVHDTLEDGEQHKDADLE